MVDYVPPWEPMPRESLHAAHEMPLSQVRSSAGALAALLDENKDEQVLKEACLGLCQLFGEGIQNDRIQAILEANVVPKLVALLRPSKSRSVPISVQSAALQVLGNVACGDDRQTQVVIDSDALPCLRALLSSADRGIRKEVCWIVSNITESSHQVQDVLDADILPPLLKLLDNQDSACREDATWVLFNLSSNRDPNQIAYLAEKNGVRALCNLLTCSKELDVLWKGCGTVAAVALKGLRNILISGQIAAASDPNGYNKMASLVAEAHGVERIEALTTHVSLDVRTRARLLLERMFGAEPTTADLSPPLPPPSVTGLSLSSPPPPPPLGHNGCSCAYQQQQHHHAHAVHQYQAGSLCDLGSTLNSHAAVSPSSHISHGMGVENSLPGHLHPDGDLIDVPGSTSGSSTDSDPEDDDSDSDLIPPPPAPCTCVLCTDPSPLAEKRPRGKGSFDDPDSHKKIMSHEGRGSEIRSICHFCSGGGRLGDGRAGLAAKLGRAVRLGHSHCLAILLSRMTWSQRAAATEAPALLHPGGGPPDGGVGSSLPAVILAAQLGKPECLALLLKRCKPDLDVTHGKKRLTALAWAAHKGYMRCCQLLIEYGAKSATKCGDGVTALHLAASGGGHIAICKLLLDHNAPVSARSAKKQTPLCLAAQKGFVKVVQLLLEHGADPNNEDEGKYTPLHLSASNGFVSSVELLLKAGARVEATTRNGVTPLHYAVQGGHAAVVKLLIAAGASVNCNRKPLLLIAADDGNLEVVQILLDANAAINCKANIKAHLEKDNEFFDYLTPLHLAASKNHQEVVELLLRRGANVNELTTKSMWSALDFAVLNGHAECAVNLLQHGAFVSDHCKSTGRSNWTLVQHAANHGAKDVVRLLIQRLKEQRLSASNGLHDGGKQLTSSIPETSVITDGSPSSTSLPNGMTKNQSESGDILTSDTVPAEVVEREGRGYSCSNEHGACHHHHHHSQGTIDPSLRATHRYDPRSLEGDESGFGTGQGYSNGSQGVENGAKSSGSRRRSVKDDRQSALRARELRKREQEATEARDRLEEAISQRSVSKLTEAIAHVSKLVFHLATTVGSDVGNGSGHVDYNDVNGYGAHGDPYGHGSSVHSPGNKTSSSPASASALSAPLPMEVGLGNEVQKARKILAGLLAEEKKLREEKEKEVADSRRENAQQTVKKAISAALDGGDPRSLSRAANRATRTILSKEDPTVAEAHTVSALIATLEKWEGEMKTAMEEKDLGRLSKALPATEKALTDLRSRSGEGAALRVFGGSEPEGMLRGASCLLQELEEKRESEKAKEAAARDLERTAHEDLETAISSSNMVNLEAALERANAALISKQSELAMAIESGKKLLTKWLKGERRKLRQASNTNNPSTIEAAAAAAERVGLQALGPDIATAKALAQKLRDQAAAVKRLEGAISSSDVAALTDIRGTLNALGMFSEAEKAREELERLQRATRARTLLEGAIQESQNARDPIAKAFSESESPDDIFGILSSWTWPDAQRLCDLSERARKYGESLTPLCDSADKLATELSVLGRQILSLLKKSNDARAIAAIIAGYEKSFVTVSRPELFDSAASKKAVADAKSRLAEVQAMDQASVKAESAQVKVEYALATSRRSAARNRNAKTSGAGKSHVPHAMDISASPKAGPGEASVGGDMRSPSSLSSGFVDEEISESEVGLSGFIHLESSSKGLEGSKSGAAKKTRATNHQTDDSGLLDALGEGPPALPGDCSHFYLHKEGTTVSCARCGNNRNSSNPEWLARVKRRGNKLPPELMTSTLPSVGSGSDLHASFQAAQMKTQSRSPSTLNGGGLGGERNGGRGRAQLLPVGSHHMSQGFPMAVLPPGRDSSRPSASHGMLSGAHTPNVSMMMQILQHQQHSHAPKSGSSHHRGRGRPHVSQLSPNLNHPVQGVMGVYGSDVGGSRNPLPGGLGGSGSIGMSSNYATASSIQSLPRVSTTQTQMRGYGMGGGASLPGLDPKSGLPISNDVDAVGGVASHGLHVGGMRSGHAAGRANVDGSGRMNAPVRSTGGEEVGGSGMDLGLDFANENFGFDIDAIVDDIPPPGPNKPGGGSDSGTRTEVPKMFVPSAHSEHNGFFRR